jgi:hypothetical protein
MQQLPVAESRPNIQRGSMFEHMQMDALQNFVQLTWWLESGGPNRASGLGWLCFICLVVHHCFSLGFIGIARRCVLADVPDRYLYLLRYCIGTLLDVTVRVAESFGELCSDTVCVALDNRVSHPVLYTRWQLDTPSRSEALILRLTTAFASGCYLELIQCIPNLID